MMNRNEFESTLNYPLDYWGKKSAEEVEVLLGKDAAKMVGFNQRNPHHCYDLWEHTLHVTEGCKESASVELKIAAFFHDIGKPAVAMEKNGQLVFYGHAEKSAEIMISILKTMGYTEKERQMIGFYIRHHDDFISWVLPEEAFNRRNPHLVTITKKHFTKHLQVYNADLPAVFTHEDCSAVWKNLLILCWADASAQAELVFRERKIIDTRGHKLEKINRLQNYCNGFMNFES